MIRVLTFVLLSVFAFSGCTPRLVRSRASKSPRVSAKTAQKEISRARKARAAGDLEAAARHLERTNEAIRRGISVSPATQAAFQQEKSRLSNALVADVEGILSAHGPFTAESHLARYPILDREEFLAVRSAVAERIKAEGARRCERLTTEADETPYWSVVVAQYCARWGVDVSPSSHLPGTFSRIEWTGRIRGLSTVQRDGLRARIAELFQRTTFYRRDAGVMNLDFAGLVEVKTESTRKQMSARWEKVETRKVQEEYQEPYTVLENRPAYRSVPDTFYVDYSYSCGTSICYGKRAVATTRMESYLALESVTKYRTATRWVVREQRVPQTFEFSATEHVSHYRADLSLIFRSRSRTEVARLRQQRSNEARGLAHTTTFKPAGVKPTQANLPGPTEWFGSVSGELASSFVAGFIQQWRERHCVPKAPSLEDATRCFYSGSQLHDGHREVLVRAFGEDTPSLWELVVGSFSVTSASGASR